MIFESQLWLKSIQKACLLLAVLFTAGTVYGFDSNLRWPEHNFYFGPDHPLSIRNADVMLSINAQFPALFNLLPLRFAIHPVEADPVLQASVDRAYMDVIRRSETARSLCQTLAAGSLQNLEIRLGVSRKAASKLASSCLTKDNKSEQPRAVEQSVLTKRKIFVVFTNDRKKVDSWTSITQNATFVFVEKSDLNTDYLVRTLIHELAIYADGKNRQLQKIIEQNPVIVANRDLKGSLYNPRLIATFATIRALEIEAKAMDEFNGIKSQNLVNQSCKDKVYQVLSATRSVFEKSFSIDEFIFARWVAAGISDREVKSQIQHFYNIEFLLRTLSENRVPGKSQNFCEFLTAPELSKPFLAIGSGGPRPNISGGWGHQEISQDEIDLINKDSMDSSVKNVLSTIRTLSKTGGGDSLNSITVDMFFQESEAKTHDGLDPATNRKYILEGLYGGR